MTSQQFAMPVSPQCYNGHCQQVLHVHREFRTKALQVRCSFVFFSSVVSIFQMLPVTCLSPSPRIPSPHHSLFSTCRALLVEHAYDRAAVTTVNVDSPELHEHKIRSRLHPAMIRYWVPCPSIATEAVFSCEKGLQKAL